MFQPLTIVEHQYRLKTLGNSSFSSAKDVVRVQRIAQASQFKVFSFSFIRTNLDTLEVQEASVFQAFQTSLQSRIKPTITGFYIANNIKDLLISYC